MFDSRKRLYFHEIYRLKETSQGERDKITVANKRHAFGTDLHLHFRGIRDRREQTAAQKFLTLRQDHAVPFSLQIVGETSPETGGGGG